MNARGGAQAPTPSCTRAGPAFPRSARHEHPALPFLLAWRSTSTLVPACAARAPPGKFPVRADHPSPQPVRRECPLLDNVTLGEPLLPGRVAQAPFLALQEPLGTGVLPLTGRVPQLKDMLPQLPRRGSSLAGPALSTGHGAVPHREPCVPKRACSGPHLRQHALNWAQRGPEPVILVSGKD